MVKKVRALPEKVEIFKLGMLENIKLSNINFDRAYVIGSKRVTGKNYSIFLPAESDKPLPHALTWNCSLHDGVEQLNIIFEASAGKYILNLATVENHIRRIRKGTNLVWDGDSKVVRETGTRRDFGLNDKTLKEYLRKVENQLESPNPSCEDVDFWLIDEIANEPHSALFTISLNDVELGMFVERNPKRKLAGPDEFRERVITVPILCETNGIHRLTIKPCLVRNHRFWDAPWGRCSSARIMIAGVSLNKVSKNQLMLPLHPLVRRKSRRYPADFYGWQLSVFHQRYNPKGINTTYFEKICRELFYRGGCFIDVYLTDCNSTAGERKGIIPWPADLAIEGKDKYNYNSNSNWGENELKEMLHFSQSTGLLACWYTHLPHIPDHWASLDWDWIKNFTQVILKQFAAMTTSPQDRLQGLIYETAGFANDIDMLLLNELLWQINPLLFFGESENENKRTTAGLTPSRIRYHATTDFAWESMFPDTRHLDPCWSESQYGICSFFGQMNCRDKKYTSIYGQMGPDAIVKQVNDTIRSYNLQEKSCGRLTGFEWIAESPEVTSQRNREVVYSSSCDPIYGALAFEAETYGKGGRMDQCSRRFEHQFHFRQRYPYQIPHTAMHLQNNYFQLSISPENDSGMLLFDLSASANFSGNGSTAKISNSFLATSIIGSSKVLHNEIKIKNRGPYLAGLSENLTLNLNEPLKNNILDFVKIEEQREYYTISDMPILHIEIKRDFKEAELETQNFIDLNGYDEVLFDKEWYKSIKPLTIPFTGQTILISDSRGVLPDLALVFQAVKVHQRKPSTLRWVSGYGLGIWWENPKKKLFGIGGKEIHPLITGKQGLSMDLIILGTLYSQKDFKYLKNLWVNCFYETRESETKITNNYNLPLVKIAKLGCRKQKLPFWVGEDKTWYFRGAQSLDENSDCVKCYLPSRASAIIRRWGYIADFVKPSPGNQYILNIKAVKKTSVGGSLEVEVCNLSPAVNPALDFINNIKSVKINGRHWHVYDEKRLYLPKTSGIYYVKVKFGKSTQLHIIASQALIKKTDVDNNILTFESEYPNYTINLPKSVHFYAAIKLNRKGIVNLEGAELASVNDEIVIIKFKKGKTKVELV